MTWQSNQCTPVKSIFNVSSQCYIVIEKYYRCMIHTRLVLSETGASQRFYSAMTDNVTIIEYFCFATGICEIKEMEGELLIKVVVEENHCSYYGRTTDMYPRKEVFTFLYWLDCVDQYKKHNMSR